MIDNVIVRKTGPLFDGRALVALDAYTTAMTEEVGQQAFDMLQNEMSASFRNPTGFYASRVVVDRQTDDRVLVDDQGVIYGPWLEGVSGRNAATRFKGYAHWRRTTQAIDGKAEGIAEQVLPPFLARMNS